MSHPCIFIQGPTATGKSQLAMDLASIMGASILNADSIQLYEGLQIGSAAPSKDEKEKVPHHLFQVIPKGETWTASQYEQTAWELLQKELVLRPVLVVGGSGFYFSALEKGMGDSKPEDPGVRAQLEEDLKTRGADQLHKELSECDPEAAAKIHPQDHYRLLRSLGYFRTYGRKMSEDQKLKSVREWPGPLIKVGFWATREQLEPVVRARVEKMNALGFEKEVESLFKEGLESWWPLQSVGYKEWVEVLQGDLSRDSVVDAIVKSTLYLAKRQKTWFQRDKDLKWFSMDQKDQAFNWVLEECGLDLKARKLKDEGQS